MEKEIIAKLHSEFEEIVQVNTDTGAECWFARDIQSLLGYAKWENFEKVIDKAKISCKNAGLKEEDHFLDIRKMVQIGSGSNLISFNSPIKRGAYLHPVYQTLGKHYELGN